MARAKSISAPIATSSIWFGHLQVRIAGLILCFAILQLSSCTPVENVRPQKVVFDKGLRALAMGMTPAEVQSAVNAQPEKLEAAELGASRIGGENLMLYRHPSYATTALVVGYIDGRAVDSGIWRIWGTGTSAQAIEGSIISIDEYLSAESGSMKASDSRVMPPSIGRDSSQ
jgi:hypothetical protein